MQQNFASHFGPKKIQAKKLSHIWDQENHPKCPYQDQHAARHVV